VYADRDFFDSGRLGAGPEAVKGRRADKGLGCGCASHGMTEEQAYLHLRYRSRSTRRRLGEVAQEFIEGGRQI
jgi:hypothetical protein